MTDQPGNPWKPIAIVLGLLLALALIAIAMMAAGVLQLGLSLL